MTPEHWKEFHVFCGNQIARFQRRLEQWEGTLKWRLVLVYPQDSQDIYWSIKELERSYYCFEYDERRERPNPYKAVKRKRGYASWKGGYKT